MSVGRICVRSVVTADPEDTVWEAARRMKDHGVGTLVVLGSGGIPAGILTDRDVVVRVVAEGLDPEATAVEDVMTAPVHDVQEATPIEDALELMASAGTRRLVVTDGDDRLVGILALDDTLELLAEEVESVGKLLRR